MLTHKSGRLPHKHKKSLLIKSSIKCYIYETWNMLICFQFLWFLDTEMAEEAQIFFSPKTKTHSFYMGNTMVVDDLATQDINSHELCCQWQHKIGISIFFNQVYRQWLCNVCMCWLFSTWTKWLPFHRRHIQTFSWMYDFVFWSKFLWSLFLTVQLTITQCWFR